MPHGPIGKTSCHPEERVYRSQLATSTAIYREWLIEDLSDPFCLFTADQSTVLMSEKRALLARSTVAAIPPPIYFLPFDLSTFKWPPVDLLHGAWQNALSVRKLSASVKYERCRHHSWLLRMYLWIPRRIFSNKNLSLCNSSSEVLD